jgi:hypothetical protein
MMSPLGGKRAFFPAVILLLVFAGPGSAAEHVHIMVVDSGYDYEITVKMLTLHPQGDISALGGNGAALDDKKLSRIIAECGGEKSKKCEVRLMVAKEGDVSVDTLGKALQRMRELADPNVELTIYLSLKGVKATQKD